MVKHGEHDDDAPTFASHARYGKDGAKNLYSKQDNGT